MPYNYNNVKMTMNTSLYSNNAMVYYKSNSLPSKTGSHGLGTNSRTVSKRT